MLLPGTELLIQSCHTLHGGLLSRRFFADLAPNCNSDDFRLIRLWGTYATSRIQNKGLNYYSDLGKAQYVDYHPIYLAYNQEKICVATFYSISDSILFSDLIMSIIFPDMDNISGEPFYDEDKYLDCSTIYRHLQSPISIHCMY